MSIYIYIDMYILFSYVQFLMSFKFTVELMHNVIPDLSCTNNVSF